MLFGDNARHLAKLQYFDEIARGTFERSGSCKPMQALFATSPASDSTNQTAN